MNQPPNRGTRQLNSGGKTSGFGDAFVSSHDTPQSQRTTRPLKMPAHMLKDAVPERIAETKKDLDYVRHLTDLFRPHINVFRYAETLLSLPEEAEGEGEALPDDFSDFAQSEPLLARYRLSPEKTELARAVSARIASDPKLRQRVQIAIHQYTEAEQNYQKAVKGFGVILKSAPDDAWDLMDELGIERLKGKAYAICGFFDNFKDDPILGRVFPPPMQHPQLQKPRLIMESDTATKSPATRPLPQNRLQVPPEKKQSGFLDNLMGIFGIK